MYLIKNLNYGANHPALEEAVGSWYIPGSEKVKLYISSDFTFKLYDNSNGKKEFLSGKVIFDKNVLKLDYSDSVMQKFKFFKFFKEEDNLYIDDEIYRFENKSNNEPFFHCLSRFLQCLFLHIQPLRRTNSHSPNFPHKQPCFNSGVVSYSLIPKTLIFVSKYKDNGNGLC